MSRVFFYEMSIVFSQVAFKAWNLQSTCMYNFQKMCIIIYIYVYTYYVTYIIFLPILRICIYKCIYIYIMDSLSSSPKKEVHIFFSPARPEMDFPEATVGLWVGCPRFQV